MKIIIIFIFTITGLFFFSCENDGELIIKASLPVRTVNDNAGNQENTPDNNDNADNGNIIDRDRISDFTNHYIPGGLLDNLDNDNVFVKLHVLTPNGQHHEFRIAEPQSEVIEDKEIGKVLDVSFNAFLAEGKNRILVVQVGSIKNTRNEDANNGLLFTGAKFINIEKGKTYEPIELHPVINLRGKIITSDNEGIAARVTAYPAFLKNRDEYFSKIRKESRANGVFALSSIYGLFQNKYTDVFKKEYFNILLTAVQGDKAGFGITGKEYQEFDNIKDSTTIQDEYSCYKYYSYEGSGACSKSLDLKCRLFNSECFETQSGNLLPGINIVSDIKIYSREEALNGAVSSVNSPKFAKMASPDGDPYSETYYGNFFISGFNLNKFFDSRNIQAGIPEGTIRIYYDLPQSSSSIENIKEFYLEYTGPFNIYNVGTLVNTLKGKNAQVMQNRLPFFKLYQFDPLMIDSVSMPYIPEFQLTDGLDDAKNSFLGVNNLKKLTSKYKIKRVEFSSELNPELFMSTCKTIYNTEDESYCKSQIK